VEKRNLRMSSFKAIVLSAECSARMNTPGIKFQPFKSVPPEAVMFPFHWVSGSIGSMMCLVPIVPVSSYCT
jgi:hypothetical protein